MPPPRPATFCDRLRARVRSAAAALPTALLMVLLAWAPGCTPSDGAASDAPDPGAPAAAAPAAAPLPAPVIPEDAPVVAFLGDSISAGLHLAKGEAYPALLQRTLAGRGLPFHLVNAGVSGSTTAAGLERADWILGRKPDVVVVQLGANDGFRGVAAETIAANLSAIVGRVREAGATPVLLGMRLPPNYGVEYTRDFDALYPRLAEELDVAFVPFFMQGVAGEPGMNLPDGIHPTPAGHARLAENVADALADVLRSAASR